LNGHAWLALNENRLFEVMLIIWLLGNKKPG